MPLLLKDLKDYTPLSESPLFVTPEFKSIVQFDLSVPLRRRYEKLAKVQSQEKQEAKGKKRENKKLPRFGCVDYTVVVHK